MALRCGALPMTASVNKHKNSPAIEKYGFKYIFLAAFMCIYSVYLQHASDKNWGLTAGAFLK